ncbi:hypothetical protein F4781DRAFT_434273 [Annulohypoxylon bovei var. microspora]|nr:hypothetical protein F4781DRAFT_434273 [Annulohypoxylon bovei var. microspora]
MDKLVWRKAIKVTSTIRPGASRSLFINGHQLTRHASSAPSIIQPAFWKSMIPKPFRRRPEPTVDWGVPKKPKSKEWNPATFYIIIFLFIGSMSIQMIALKRDFDTFMRRAEVRIGLLREVVEKLQKGEEVDVEKALGTSDAEKEKEWEEVLREIERDDILKNANKTEKTKPIAPTSPVKAEAKGTDSTVPPKTRTGSYSSFF